MNRQQQRRRSSANLEPSAHVDLADHSATPEQPRPEALPEIAAPAGGHSIAAAPARATSGKHRTIQPKLAIGAADDLYEQEADRVADQVVRNVNRPSIQRAATSAAGVEVTPEIATGVKRLRGGGQPLAPAMRNQMEQHFGHDFAQVRVHTNAQASNLTRRISARAFTVGSDVAFAPGQYQPDTAEGQRLLAHELTHVVQQGEGGSLIQAKLMTSAYLKEQTGDKGAKLFVTRNYSRILQALQNYENLEKNDLNRSKKTERAQILTQLLGDIEAWLASESRSFNHAKEERSAVEDKKLDLLMDLKEQAEAERKLITKIEIPAPSTSPSQGQPGDPPQGRQRRNAIVIAHTSNAVLEARAEAEVKQKTIDSKIVNKTAKFFKLTFGTSFSVRNALALDPKTALLPSEIKHLIKLMDQAASDEQMLLGAGVEPVRALALAYMGLPEQIQPNSPNPEAKLAIQVKRQLLQEASDEADEKAQKRSTQYGDFKPTKFEKLKRKIIGKAPTAKEGAEEAFKNFEQVKERAEEPFGVADSINSAVSDVVGDANDVVEKVAHSSSDTLKGAGNVTNVSGAGFAALGLFKSVLDTISMIKLVFKKDATELELKEGIENGIGLIHSTLMSGLSLMDSLAKLSGLDNGIPGMGIVTGVLQGIKNLVEGIRTGYRGFKEHRLAGKAEEEGSALQGALKFLSKRNVVLTVRSGVELITNAIKIISGALKLVAVTEPAGTILGVIGTTVSIGNSVISLMHDSYRAGLAQESAMQAQSGQIGADVKVFQNNSTWAVTGIIVAAKEGNQFAIDELALYGVAARMLTTSSVPDIRKYILKKLSDSDDAKNFTQKALSIVPKSVRRKLGM